MNVYITLNQLIHDVGFECSHEYQSLPPSKSSAQGFAKSNPALSESFHKAFNIDSFLAVMPDVNQNSPNENTHKIVHQTIVETRSADELDALLEAEYQVQIQHHILNAHPLLLDETIAKHWYITTHMEDDDVVFCTIAFKPPMPAQSLPLTIIPITAAHHAGLHEAITYDGVWVPVDNTAPYEICGSLEKDTGVLVITETGQSLVLYYADDELHLNQLAPVSHDVHTEIKLFTERVEHYDFITNDVKVKIGERLSSHSYVDQWLALGQVIRLYNMSVTEYDREIQVTLETTTSQEMTSLQAVIDRIDLPMHSIFEILMGMEGWGYLAEEYAVRHISSLHQLLDEWDVIITPDTFDVLWDDSVQLQKRLTNICIMREQVACIESALALIEIETILTSSIASLDQRAIRLLSTMPKEIFNPLCVDDAEYIPWVKIEGSWWTRW